MHENELARLTLDAAFRVHRHLGPGLLESAYQECLFYEIREMGLPVSKEHPLPLVYKEVQLETGYRTDLLIAGKLIVEVKAVDHIHNLHLAQVLTYLKLSGCKLGLLLNFNVEYLREGIKRIIHGKLAPVR